LPVYTYAFPEILQVRGGVQAHLITGLLQDGGQHMARRALAVSTGYMYGFELVLRIIQQVTQLQCIMQIILQGYGAYPGKHGQVLVEVINSLLIVHKSWYYRKAIP
jgi:hypothetical protein